MKTQNDFSEFKVIGFDLDQTLFPKSPGIDQAIQVSLYKKIANHSGCSLEEAAKRFCDLYKDGAGLSGGQTMEKLGVPNPKEAIQEALETADIASFLKPDPEVTQLLWDLRSKFGGVDLVTGSHLLITKQKLEKLQIPLEIFRHVIAGDAASKSDGEAYKLWLSYYPEFTPEQFLYVGDRSSSDYDVPRTLGIQSVLVNVKEKKPEVLCLQLSKLLELRDILL